MDIRYGAVQEADVVLSGTGHSHTGGTDGSTLGLDALQVDEQSAQNAALVTVDAGGNDLAVLPQLTVAVGDRILFCVGIIATKGLTAGTCIWNVYKLSGTATINFANNSMEASDVKYVAASGVDNTYFTIIGKITVAGTLNIRLRGYSNGSNSTVDAGDGEIFALVLRGIG